MFLLALLLLLLLLKKLLMMLLILLVVVGWSLLSKRVQVAVATNTPEMLHHCQHKTGS
jgi:hypothetical protein